MSHLVKIVISAAIFGCILGLVIFGVLLAFEDIFATSRGASFGRRGPAIVPGLIGAAAGWVGMKALERFSGIGGAVLICGFSLLGGGCAVGVVKFLGDANLHSLAPEKVLTLGVLAAAGFVVTATWMAYMDE